MEAHGCQIVCRLNADSPDGFEGTVTKNRVTRGPFMTVLACQIAARDWDEIWPENAQSSDDGPLIKSPQLESMNATTENT